MPSFRNIHGLVGIARSRLDWSWRLRWFLGVAAWGAGAILLAALVTRVVPRLALPAESPVWLWLTGAALLAAPLGAHVAQLGHDFGNGKVAHGCVPFFERNQPPALSRGPV